MGKNETEVLLQPSKCLDPVVKNAPDLSVTES